MQKGQALIFILLGMVIAAFVGVAFYAGKITPKPPSEVVTSTLSPAPSPSPIDETANWKTYTNTGFSFKYPDNYFKYQEQSVAGIYLAPSQGEGGNGPKFLKMSDIWLDATFEPSNVSSIDEYLNLYPNAQKTPIKMNGVSGYKVEYSFAAVAGNVTIYTYAGIVLRNENIYKITLSAWSQNTLKSNQLMFDQILSTFKFADQQLKVTKQQAIDCVKKEATKDYPNEQFTVTITSEDANTYYTSVYAISPSNSLMGWFPVNKITCETHLAKP